MEKILVTQGLNELKTLENRIYKKIRETVFVAGAKNIEKNVEPGVTKDDFENNVKAEYTSINDLIERREKIKAAIIASNAVTEVEIAGEKMTVAKAIDTKESIKYKKALLNSLKEDYGTSTAAVNTNNSIVNQNIDKLIQTAYGKESKDRITEKDYDAIAKPYKIANEWNLVDPLGIKEKIDALDSYIEEFEAEVDAKLQISNCITYIEI